MSRSNIEALVSRLVLELEREGLCAGRYRVEHALYKTWKTGIADYQARRLSVDAPDVLHSSNAGIEGLIAEVTLWLEKDGWELSSVYPLQPNSPSLMLLVFKRFVPVETS